MNGTVPRSARSESRRRTRLLAIRLLPSEFARWHIVAANRGISTAELVRRAVEKEIGESPALRSREADTPAGVTELADGLVGLARTALAFGRINRTAVYHPDQATPESDTDHTVMLGWAACAIAATWFPQLDLGLVAQFALVHDAPEVYAGDTPTLRITAEGRAAKAAREAAAVDRLAAEFAHRLPWFPQTLRSYEEQCLPEARFVRGVDKIMPKLVHLLDQCAGLLEHGISRAELADAFTEQRQDMASYVGEFHALMDVWDELVRRVLDRPELEYPAVAR